MSALLLAAPYSWAQQRTDHSGSGKQGQTQAQGAKSGANAAGSNRDTASGTQRTSGGVAAHGAVAQQCLDDLRALNQKAQRDGYWLSGWGTMWGTGTTPAGRASPAARSTRTAADGQAPWMGARWGMTSPRYQLRTLYGAANVLAHRGDQDGCRAVIAELRSLYDNYVVELKAAGVEPGEITSWRQEQILSAQPVTSVADGLINVADVTGTEVRNAKDEELGTVEDVIVDSASGGIRYVIVSTGGWLGMGEDYVAVPWNALNATPGLNTLVLKVTQDTLENAPKVDPDRFGAADRQMSNRSEIDSYWKKHSQG
ncbi:MAG: PRC-barrel domain-containing protein [Alphaproteobacteria bacterium]